MQDEAELPAGTVTFLFTDIEGSTALWEADAVGMLEAQKTVERTVAEAVATSSGVVFKTTGDGSLAAFHAAPDALTAALTAQLRLLAAPASAPVPIRVRMAIHTGTAFPEDGDYLGRALNRCARFLGTAHGGQIVVSAATAELTTVSLPPELGLADLGTYRLRGLPAPERLFQLTHPDLAAAHPPLRAQAVMQTNLPVGLSSFIGREQELHDVSALLEENRLVTLTGAGGAGKTRLAFQVGTSQAERYRDGVWIVRLASVVEPEFVVAAIADDLHVLRRPNVRIETAVLEHLRPRQVLLILDNCEHVVAGVAAFVQQALYVAPELTVLATSREGLDIAGEQLWRVPALRLSPPAASSEQLLEDAAIRLFSDRAAHVRPGFVVAPANVRTVAEICRRLDSMPLAIELAAARVGVLGVADIAARLDDRFNLLTDGYRTSLPRQRTLQATVDWSYELLDPAEMTLFRRLSVFAGGFDLAAAEAVGGPDMPVIDTLGRLIDKSMINVDDTAERRYTMLETLRQYGEARLIEQGESEATAQQHATYFASLADEARQKLRRSAAEWYQRIERELRNLRKALTWALTPPVDASIAATISADLREFWQIRGHWREAQRWFDRCLEHEDQLDDLLRGRLHHAAGVTAALQRDYAKAIPDFEAALKCFRVAGSAAETADALFDRAQAVARHGDYEVVRELLAEALTLYEASDHQVGIGETHCVLAQVAVFCDDLDTARERGRVAELHFRELGDPYGMAWSQIVLGETAYAGGDLVAAERWFRRAVSQAESIDIPQFVANGLQGLGKVAGARNDLDRCEGYLNESLRINQEIGDTLFVAGVIADLACLAVRREDPARAAQLWGQDAELRRGLGNLPPRQRGGDYDRESEELRSNAEHALGRSVFQKHLEEGRALAPTALSLG